jgi:hypothetical protein
VVLLLLANSNTKKIVILYTISVCYGCALHVPKEYEESNYKIPPETFIFPKND